MGATLRVHIDDTLVTLVEGHDLEDNDGVIADQFGQGVRVGDRDDDRLIIVPNRLADAVSIDLHLQDFHVQLGRQSGTQTVQAVVPAAGTA